MSAETRRQPRSILVAEDDRGIRGLLEVILRSDNCSVIAAKDGAEALKLADLHHVDLMLVDLNMPRLDGIAVCQQYRLRGGAAPVVLLSASADVENAARYCAADGFIAKPFNVATILDAVTRYAGAR